MACKIVIPCGQSLLIEIVSGIQQVQQIKACKASSDCEVIIDNFDEFKESVYHSLQSSHQDNYEKHCSYNAFQDSLKTAQVITDLPC